MKKRTNTQIDMIKVQKITDGVSPTTAMSSFLSWSHNVITVSAATASTEPSAEKAAALIALFLLRVKKQHDQLVVIKISIQLCN